MSYRTAIVTAAISAFVGLEVVTTNVAINPGVEVSALQGPSTDQWPAYGADPGGNRYSRLTQITQSNIGDLQVAWTYRTGELGQNAASGSSLTFEATPIHFDDRLFVSTSYGKVIALDPTTGAELWTFDANIDRDTDYSEVTSRGVSSWRDTRALNGSPCASRLFVATIDARLMSLDARSGRRCVSFGVNGQIDLARTPRNRRGRSRGNYQSTSPPAILRDHVIVGSSIGDNWSVDTGNGVVRAFDARTGAQRWSWEPILRRKWREGRTGAANAWSLISVDALRDLLFVPSTSPSPDFYGGLRPGSNADANSVVALRGSTGERVWAFQTVHHDLWDYDVAAQPALVTVMRSDGRPIAAVAQATKMGAIFLLDRVSGRPLFPIEERAVPATTVAGETSALTQPFPTAPRLLMPIDPVTPETVWGFTEADRAECRSLVSHYRSEGIYTPPSLEGSIMYPGNASGTNWGSVAFDSTRQLLITNTSRLATIVQLLARGDFDRERAKSLENGEDWEYGVQRGAPYGVRRRTLLTSTGMPCTPPPWGTLAAVDLASGDVRWEIPFGRLPDGHPARPVVGDQAIGLPNVGGPLATASGLVFIGASMDARFHAFEVETGRELWTARLPFPGMATPMTYMAADGRQMVVTAAGGHGKYGFGAGDFIVAFALPAPQ